LRPAARWALLTALAACHDATDSEKQRVIGLIEPSRTTLPVVVAPAEVAAGEEFLVTVNTVGSSGCTTPDGGDVSVTDDLIRLVPYDIVPMPGHSDVCREDYAPQRHYFPVTMAHPGAARIRVVGRRPSTNDSALDSVETPLTVTP
jgi:hypothetical protein